MAYVDCLGGAVLPDTSGNVYQEPHAVNFGSNDLFPQMVWVFADSATKDELGFRFIVPEDYDNTGTTRFLVAWGTVATTGDWEIDISYDAAAAGETGDPASSDEDLNVADTAGGTARDMEVAALTVTAANLAAGDVVQGSIARDGTDAGDTLSDDVYLLGLWLEYDAA